MFLFSISSLTSLVRQRKYLTGNIKQFISSNSYKVDFDNEEKNNLWAKILSGGYILFLDMQKEING